MLIHLPKLVRTKTQFWTEGGQQLGTAIAVVVAVTASQLWLGIGGEYLALGFGQGLGLALLWIGGEKLGWGVIGGLAIAGAATSLNALGDHFLVGTALITAILAGSSLIVARRGLIFWGFSPPGSTAPGWHWLFSGGGGVKCDLNGDHPGFIVIMAT